MTYAVLCPGQGAQHRDMLDPVIGHPAAQRTLAEASAALGTDIRSWLDTGGAMFGNEVAQPLICIAQLATWNALRDKLRPPAYIAGYSVGELASYGCADALDAATLAVLARDRAAFMQRALGGVDGGLIAIRGLALRAIDQLCAGRQVWTAIVRSDVSVVVGGRAAALDAIGSEATALGGEIRCLKVGVPAHTPLLDIAVEMFRQRLDNSDLRAPVPPVLAGVDGDLVNDRARGVITLSRQIAHTIDWARCMDTLHERGCRVFLELCPGSGLSAMFRERFNDVEARAIDDFRSLDGVVAWLRNRS